MNYRIRELRKFLKLSQKEFAEKIGLKQNAVSYMEKGGSTVTEQNIKAICSQFSVNENWLRTGNGKMIIENERKQKEFFDIFDELAPELQDYIIKTAKDLLATQRKMESTKEETADSLEPTDIKTEVEKAEAEYIKSISKSAHNTKFLASCTMQDINENKNKAI